MGLLKTTKIDKEYIYWWTLRRCGLYETASIVGVDIENIKDLKTTTVDMVKTLWYLGGS